MNWLPNLNIRTKLFLGSACTIACLAVVIGVTAKDYSAAQARHRVVTSQYRLALALSAVRADVSLNRSGALQFFFTPDRASRDRLAAELRARAAAVDQELASARAMVSSEPETTRSLDELSRLLAEQRTTRNQQIARLNAGDAEGARKLATGVQQSRFLAIERASQALEDGAIRAAQGALNASDLQAQDSLRFFTLVGALAVAISLGIAGLLYVAIAKPMRALAGAAAQVAVASEEIVASATQVASGAAETASAISETSTTVEEVRQTAQVASQKARDVSDNAQRAVQVSTSGREAVDESTQVMQRIREQMASVAESTVRLSERGQAIGEIIATVNDLAEQSNLLAVNAAIEAARAGEHGRGFGVVAQEVKSLAEQSRQATAQVREILSEIQRATAATVMATEQGSRAVDAGVRQVGEAGESIRRLADVVQGASQAAIQIAASSQQQFVGMDQVALAMENIKQASAQNAAGMRQAEGAAQNLRELGRQLRELVNRHRL